MFILFDDPIFIGDTSLVIKLEFIVGKTIGRAGSPNKWKVYEEVIELFESKNKSPSLISLFCPSK